MKFGSDILSFPRPRGLSGRSERPGTERYEPVDKVWEKSGVWGGVLPDCWSTFSWDSGGLGRGYETRRMWGWTEGTSVARGISEGDCVWDVVGTFSFPGLFAVGLFFRDGHGEQGKYPGDRWKIVTEVPVVVEVRVWVTN